MPSLIHLLSHIIESGLNVIKKCSCIEALMQQLKVILKHPYFVFLSHTFAQKTNNKSTLGNENEKPFDKNWG